MDKNWGIDSAAGSFEELRTKLLDEAYKTNTPSQSKEQGEFYLNITSEDEIKCRVDLAYIRALRMVRNN